MRTAIPFAVFLAISATAVHARPPVVHPVITGTIIGAKEYQNAGVSEAGQICTSHIERSNLTIRMQNRRWTRLTNAFSKSWENHILMFALFVAWYNFCRPHMTLKTTPGVAAGLASETWSVERLLWASARTSLIG